MTSRARARRAANARWNARTLTAPAPVKPRPAAPALPQQPFRPANIPYERGQVVRYLGQDMTVIYCNSSTVTLRGSDGQMYIVPVSAIKTVPPTLPQEQSTSAHTHYPLMIRPCMAIIVYGQ